MPHLPLVLLAFLVAAFTQGATGFGFGLVVMSVLPMVLDVRTAVPIVSILALVMCGAVLIRWIRHLDAKKVLPLLLGEALGTPLGVLFLTTVDRRWVTGALGLVLVLYAGRTLWRERRVALPPPSEAPLPSRLWGVVAGFLGGILGGAFNTGGPPVIVYATARRWAPGAFRANLQAAFLFNTCFQMVMFWRHGLLTAEVGRGALVALPALLVGIGAGLLAGERLDAHRFRRVVLGLLLAFGVVYLVRALLG